MQARLPHKSIFTTQAHMMWCCARTGAGVAAGLPLPLLHTTYSGKGAKLERRAPCAVLSSCRQALYSFKSLCVSGVPAYGDIAFVCCTGCFCSQVVVMLCTKCSAAAVA